MIFFGYTSASCTDPGKPRNGERIGTNFAHEDHVQFLCNPGFWLVGSQLIACNEGIWSNDIPKCKGIVAGIQKHAKVTISAFKKHLLL